MTFCLSIWCYLFLAVYWEPKTSICSWIRDFSMIIAFIFVTVHLACCWIFLIVSLFIMSFFHLTRERLSQELRRSVLSSSSSTSGNQYRDASNLSSSLINKEKDGLASPIRQSSRRALSPELLLSATPEKSVLRSPTGSPSRSPHRSKSLGFTWVKAHLLNLMWWVATVWTMVYR